MMVEMISTQYVEKIKIWVLKKKDVILKKDQFHGMQIVRILASRH